MHKIQRSSLVVQEISISPHCKAVLANGQRIGWKSITILLMDYSYESLQTVMVFSSNFEAYDSQKEDINISEARHEAREESKMLE